MSGRAATINQIPGKYALSVGRTEMPAPEGWDWFELGKIARLESGHTPRREHPEYWDGDIAWIGIKDARIHHGATLHQTLQTVTQAGIDNSAARLLPAGTVCLSRTASVGYVTVMGRSMATSQDFVNWVCGPRLDPQFLKQLLIAENESLFVFGKGTTHTTIYYPEVKAFHVCLPPLPEQRRIVAKLEALQSRSRRAREALEAVPPLLEKLRQSILAAAFRGDLTADWREQHLDVEPASELLKRIRIERRKKWEQAELAKLKAKGKTPTDDRWKQKYVEPEPVDDSELPELPEGWGWERLGNLGDDPLNAVQTGPFGAMLHNDEFVDDGVPVIAVGNLTGMGFRREGTYFITSQKAHELSRFDVQAGDALFARSGATLGKVCVAPNYVKDWQMTGHILRLRLKQNYLRSELAVFALAGASAVQEQVADGVRGVTRPGYNTSLLEAIMVPIPPREEQDALVIVVSSLLVVLEAHAVGLAELSNGLSRLDSAILSKAFRGELVPQDPNDGVESQPDVPETNATPQKRRR